MNRKKIFSKLMVCLLLVACVVSGPTYNATATPYTVISSYNQVRTRYINTIYPNVKIYTAEDLDLSELVITYWFVVDNDYDDFEQFFCDYAHMSGPYQNKNITSKVHGFFQDVTRPRPDGKPQTVYTHIVNIYFDDSAGTLKAGSTLELKTRIAAPDWSTFDQYNDPSFNPTATTYTVGDDVIVYYMGTPLN
jgi:hypothetical protein